MKSGMKLIDPKYGIEVREGEPFLVKVTTGEPIPDDEPLILFRARDWHAVGMLIDYRARCEADCCTPEHMAGIANRLDAFRRFTEQHPARMKQPGISRDTKLS
jgi:hypothetical protein